MYMEISYDLNMNNYRYSIINGLLRSNMINLELFLYVVLDEIILTSKKMSELSICFLFLLNKC